MFFCLCVYVCLTKYFPKFLKQDYKYKSSSESIWNGVLAADQSFALFAAWKTVFVCVLGEGGLYFLQETGNQKS